MKNNEEFSGSPELQAWLEGRGFRVFIDPIPDGMNRCNWYACRRTILDARECETNGHKVQMVIQPYEYPHIPGGRGGHHTSVEAVMTGESGGVWYRLMAYSMSHGELMEKLDAVEAALVRAWNALCPS